MTQVSTGETEVVAKKPETTNEHEKTREKKERVRPPTKVVIRRLPPTLTKEAFINQISPLPEHDYLYFVRPDKSLGPFAFSRAYINFIKQEDIFTFKEQFDNYTFMDKKGNEYPAVVEFSPFQRLPKKRMGRKKDPKMGTLEQDPAYVSFLESRTAKPSETPSTQHCPLEYFPPPEKKKITTTPLLDFLRQRRAERQRMRDERREERRRKDQERKRLKDADRDRRRGPGKPDSGSSRDNTSDSVLKVLRNPEHEKEAKDDNNRVGGSKETREKMPLQGMKRREDDRQRSNRDKDRKERQLQESRQRETKGQSVKSYRDDRQKQMEMRAQRKLPDDQRRKTSYERGQAHVKTSDSRQSHESDKGQLKISDTRRSQEFDRGSTKLSDTRRSQEFERSQNSYKNIDSRKNQEYDRQSHSNRDMDHRKHYQSSDQRKMSSERYQSYAKDSEKLGKESERKRNYRDSDSRRSERSQGYNKDTDQRRNTYNIKSPRNYNEADSKRSSDPRTHFKDDDQKQSKEEGNVKFEKQDETKKWEQMGAKPKKKILHEVPDKSEIKGDRSKDQITIEKPLDDLPYRRNSTDSSSQVEQVCDPENSTTDGKRESVAKGSKSDSEEQPRRRNSLESANEQLNYRFTTSDNLDDQKLEHSEFEVEPKDESKFDTEDESKENSKPFSSHKFGAKPSKRRGSLDSGDHESDVQGSKGMSRSATGSDWTMDLKLKRNHSLDLDGQRWEVEGEHVYMKNNFEGSIGEAKKGDRDDKDKDFSGNGADGENKRDPRVERRIRNKDRPSIEIYRPGMGRFSLQRKEREKSSGSTPGTAGSSMEQESPSSSPSPTPTNNSRNIISIRPSKSGTELRSMTFKRSVSREK